MVPVRCRVTFLKLKLGLGKDLGLGKLGLGYVPLPDESMHAGLDVGVLDGVVGVRGVVGLGVVAGQILSEASGGLVFGAWEVHREVGVSQVPSQLEQLPMEGGQPCQARESAPGACRQLRTARVFRGVW